MLTEPLVSVIIPCYNSEKWIEETLDSVFNQTYTNYEVIVIDDGSTDNTKNVLEKYKEKIKYIFQNNKGPSSARNKGIKNACGEYIAFLDSDDIWVEDKLSKQMNYLLNNPNVDLVFSNVTVIDESGNSLYEHYNNVPTKKEKLIKSFFMGKIGMNTPTIVAKSKSIKEIGGFNENLPSREDHFLLMKFVDRYEVFHFSEPLVKRRMRINSMSQAVKPEEAIKVMEPFIKISLQEFPYIKNLIKKAYSEVFMYIAKLYWKNDEFSEAIKFVNKSIKKDPQKIKSYAILIMILMGFNYNKFVEVKLKIKSIVNHL